MATTPQNTQAVQGTSATGASTQPPPSQPVTSKPATPSPVAKVVVANVKPLEEAKKPAFEVTTLQNRKRWLKALYYGKNGAGKTELAGTCADVEDMSDVFVVNAEKGELTLEQTDRIQHKERIFVANCNTITEVEQMKLWLISHCIWRDYAEQQRVIKKLAVCDPLDLVKEEETLKKLESAIGFENPGRAKRFRTCVVDSLTELQAFSMYKILGIGNTMAFDANMPDREWSHFNKILANVQVMARAFRDLQMNVILLCQENRTQDDTKKFIYGPMLEGQMAKRIMGFVDQVGYITIVRDDKGVEQRHLIVQPGYGFEAKNRAGIFKGKSFVDPYMPDIMKAIGWGAVASPTPSTTSTAN